MSNKHEKELFIILDEALDRVLKGEAIELVLADYPRAALELEPLLRTALGLKDAAAITPRPEFRTQAALDFQRAIQGMPVKAKADNVTNSTPRTSRRGLFGWGTAWSIGVAVILVVLLSGTGVATAANYAMPDSPLYSVKMAEENVQLTLTLSDVGKAELISRFNDRRVNEVVDMANKGLVAEIGNLNTQLASNMVKISNLANNVSQTSLNDVTAGADSFSADNSKAAQSGENVMTAPRITPAATTVAAPVTKNADGTQPTEPVTQEPLKVIPTLSVISPPATSNIVPAAVPAMVPEPSADEHTTLKDNTENKWDKLREHLSEKQINNLRSLLEAYVQVPDEVKPALKEAIKIILEGYNLSTDNSLTIESLMESYGLSMEDLYR